VYVDAFSEAGFAWKSAEREGIVDVRMKSYASPNITLEDWQDGKKDTVDIFEDQLQGWLFDQSVRLTAGGPKASQHCGPALLSLVTPYFEMITCYLDGRRPNNRESSAFLRRGLETVLGAGTSAVAIKKFVSEVRNGFFHEAMFRYVVLHRAEHTGMPFFDFVPDGTGGQVLAVDPFWLSHQAHTHFLAYVALLRRPVTADDQRDRSHFDAFMAVRMK
jgi:hypothetical protein